MMRNMKMNAAHAVCLLFLAVCCMFTVTACNDDEEVLAPENWITLSNETFNISADGGTLTSDITLADGLDTTYVYVVSETSWCKAYTKKYTLYVEVDPSEELTERTAEFTIHYDNQREKTFTLTQGAAEAVKIEKIEFADMSNTQLMIGETFDLSTIVTITPANASYKDLKYTVAEGQEDMATIDGNNLTTLKPGTITVTGTAQDGTGISASTTLTVSNKKVFDRTGWKATTSITYSNGNSYVADGTTGKPEDILDGDPTTFLSLTKPGKNYNSCETPADHKLHFVVDMLKEQKFNFIIWRNRQGNSYDYLRWWGVNLYGSNDNQTWTSIQANVELPYSDNTKEHEISIPESSYRYIKVELANYSTSSGSTVQVAEFNVGYLAQ